MHDVRVRVQKTATAANIIVDDLAVNVVLDLDRLLRALRYRIFLQLLVQI